MVQCKICGRVLRSLSRHTLTHHGLTIKEYSIKFPDAKTMDDDVRENYSKAHKGRCWSKNAKGRKIISERMIKDNPAKRPEVKEKIAHTVSQLWKGPDYRQNQVDKRVGKKQTKESNQKRSLTMKSKGFKGLTFVERYGEEKAKIMKEKIRVASRRSPTKFKPGHPCYTTSPKARAKISRGRKKYFREHPESIEDIRNRMLTNNPFKGKTHSQETKQIIGKKSKENWKDPEFIDKVIRGWHLKPNKYEMFLDNLIQDACYGFKYNGDYREGIHIDRLVPDWINVETKKIIELFGDYWHNENEIPIRRKRLEKKGYKLLVIWSRELSDVDQIKQRVTKFVEG